VYGWVIGVLIVLFVAVQLYLAYRRRKRRREAAG